MQPARAQIDDKKLELRLGGFFTARDTKLGLFGPDGGGNLIDIESRLGLAANTEVFRVDANYRFSKRHQADLSYFSLSRGANRVIDQSFSIGGLTFPVGADLTSDLAVNLFKASYSYMFASKDDYELGASIGLFLQKNRAGLEQAGTGIIVNESVTLPLPVIGLRGRYKLGKRWRLSGSAETFFLSFDKYDGRLFDFRAAIEYDLFENAAIGLGYNWIDIDVDVDNARLDWTIDWRVSGILTYVRVAF